MLDATDITLNVPDHGMNPGQYLHCNLSGDLDYRLMDPIPGVQQALGTPAISTAHHALFKAICENLRDVIPAEMLDLPHARKAGPLPLGFLRDHHLRLPGCAPASCSRLGIVYFNEACEPVVYISFCHGRSDLVPIVQTVLYPLISRIQKIPRSPARIKAVLRSLSSINANVGVGKLMNSSASCT